MTLDGSRFDPQFPGGEPGVGGMRIPVVLQLLAQGMSAREILETHPELRPEDIDRCISYAALLADQRLPPQAD